MSKKLLIAASIAISCACAPMMSYAADEAATSKSEISKDKWLKSIVPMLPGLICKGFMQDADLKKRFDELKMTAEQCEAFIPESSTKCESELYPKIPETVNSETSGTWARALGECIGKDFAEKHLVPK